MNSKEKLKSIMCSLIIALVVCPTRIIMALVIAVVDIVRLFLNVELLTIDKILVAMLEELERIENHLHIWAYGEDMDNY